MGAEFLEALRAALPDLRVLTKAGEVEAYRYDETEYLHPGQPLGVVFPASTADVRAIVRLAAAHGVALVPRGAGTGLSGGATGVDGALTVVMT
ncbi:MAG TPA: FAD-binding protein, partial [Candidatus Sulfotelmatobacter sp.]|nr:FAD-binding protein [Candidatus Sulfotelmatobacter sp.]